MVDRSAAINAGKIVGALLLVVVLQVVGFAATWMIAGPLSALLYWFLFWVGLLWLPSTVFMFSPLFPKSGRKLFGLAYFALGQFAHGGSCLLQVGDGYEIVPYDHANERIYWEGEWQAMPDPDDNATMLAWQPFATAFRKEEDSFDHATVDPETAADGGTETRGGKTVRRSTETDEEDSYLLDVTRYYSEGLKKLGDIDILEKTEEVTQRDQTGDSRLGGWEPIVATVTGIVLGVGTAYVAFGGF